MHEALRVSAAVRSYLAQRAARREIELITERSIRANLLGFARAIGDPFLRDLDRRAVEKWLETKLAPSTVRTRLSQIHTFCGWAIQQGHLAADPTLGLRGPRQPHYVPRHLTADEVRRVITVCPDTRSLLVVLLMLQELLRRKEVAGLQLGDIEPTEGVALIRGKGGHERVLPLSSETREVLQRYLVESPASAGPLIRSLSDGVSGIAPVTVGRMVSALMLEAGVKRRPYDGKSGHALRHTGATDMLRAGAHVRDVQAALGHRSLATTEKYLAWEVRGLRDAMGGRHYAEGIITTGY